MVIFSDDELQRYGERYLLRLYRMVDGIMERTVDRYDLFKSTSLGGIPMEGVEQATDEIVQHLMLRDFIKMYENSKKISLTLAGKTEAERLNKQSSPVTSLIP